MKKVKKVMLFTASACPMGRTMGEVLKEVGEHYQELSLDTFYIDIHMEQTNRFRIKQNPTTLFVSDEEKELYRVEGFKETKDMISIIEKINLNLLSVEVQRQENRQTIEKYTIYLYQGDSLVPVEVEYRNLTSVSTPRITLIHLILRTRIDGLMNPFSPLSQLELVQFKDNQGTITLKEAGHPNKQDLSKMKKVLEKSLEPFGIEVIEIIC